MNFCDQVSCLSRSRFKSNNIILVQHDKAAPSTKELKSSMKLAWKHWEACTGYEK